MASVLDLALPLDSEPAYTKAVIHSLPGIGKTTFCADAPKPTWIDFERSSDALRVIPSMVKTPILRPTSFKQVVEYTKAAIPVFETLVYDTITSMQVFYMREYMVRMETQNPTKRDRYLPYQGDYIFATNELTDFFLMLQEAPINVIFNAHSNVIYTKDANNHDTSTIYQIRPALTPAVWGNLRAFINVVAYLDKKTSLGKTQPEWEMYFNTTNTIIAKNRLGIKETSIKNPQYKDIFK